MYSSSRRQCGHSMMVVLLALSCRTRAVPGIRWPHHAQKLYSSAADTMNTRRRLGRLGRPTGSASGFFSSCLLVSGAMPSSSSSRAWIAHCPNVRSLPGDTCRCRSNRYSRSSVAEREPACLPVSSVPVSRAIGRYNRVICGPLLSSCGLLVPPCVSSSVVSYGPSSSGLGAALIVSSGGDGLGSRAAMAKKTGAGYLFPVPLLA